MSQSIDHLPAVVFLPSIGWTELAKSSSILRFLVAPPLTDIQLHYNLQPTSAGHGQKPWLGDGSGRQGERPGVAATSTGPSNVPGNGLLIAGHYRSFNL